MNGGASGAMLTGAAGFATTAGAPAMAQSMGGSTGTLGTATGGVSVPAGSGGAGVVTGTAGAAGTSIVPPAGGGMPSGGAPAGAGGGGGASAVAGGGGASAGAGGASTAQPPVPSAGCGTTSTPTNGKQTMDVNGTQREFIVTAPTGYDPAKPYRLIFAWHGLGGTDTQIASGYYGLASRSGNTAIFIAAQGLPGTGQQSGLASWSNTGDGDITFTRKMLDWAKANYCIDVKRVFSIGMSNGGLMSNIVGCELGDSFRAMVAMSGGGPEGYAMKPCTGQLAVWISHGNMDNNVPFSYGEKSRDYWTRANHCGMATMPVMPGTCLEYQGCDPGFPVQFCEFDGGHMVPSFAGEAGWNFFARF